MYYMKLIELLLLHFVRNDNFEFLTTTRFFHFT